MVADSVEGLDTQIEWYEGHVCTPHRVIKATLNVRR